MSEIDARPPQPVIDRSERSGNVGLLMFLALALVVAAAAFGMMSQEQAEPYVLGLLGILSVVGVFSLFAGAIGLLRFSVRGAANPVSGAFLDAFDEGVLVTEGDGRIVYANQAYATLTNAETAADVRGVERVFATDPTAADAVFRLSQAAREDRRAQEEIRLPHPLGRIDGEPRWYRVAVRPLPVGGEGSARRRFTVWQVADVTRDRAEQETSFQELQRVINFLDHAPAGFFSADGRGQLVYLNATLADWLGFDLAQFEAGRVDLSEFVRGDGSELLRSMQGQPGEVRTETFDLDLVTKHGRGLPVRLVHRVPFGADGQPGESRTLVLNRSPGEDSSETLRAAEVRFARFFNNTPIAIASIDRNGRIAKTNAPFLRLFGTPDTKDGPARLIDFVAELSRPALQEALDSAADGRSEIPPVDVRLDDREEGRSATFYVSAVRDGEGEGEVAIVYALETTAQRVLEAQFAQGQKM